MDRNVFFYRVYRHGMNMNPENISNISATIPNSFLPPELRVHGRSSLCLRVDIVHTSLQASQRNANNFHE